jgi:hypothetical protein
VVIFLAFSFFRRKPAIGRKPIGGETSTCLLVCARPMQ